MANGKSPRARRANGFEREVVDRLGRIEEKQDAQIVAARDHEKQDEARFGRVQEELDELCAARQADAALEQRVAGIENEVARLRAAVEKIDDRRHDWLKAVVLLVLGAAVTFAASRLTTRPSAEPAPIHQSAAAH